jgi:hypothetical protein
MAGKTLEDFEKTIKSETGGSGGDRGPESSGMPMSRVASRGSQELATVLNSLSKLVKALLKALLRNCFIILT